MGWEQTGPAVMSTQVQVSINLFLSMSIYIYVYQWFSTGGISGPTCFPYDEVVTQIYFTAFKFSQHFSLFLYICMDINKSCFFHFWVVTHQLQNTDLCKCVPSVYMVLCLFCVCPPLHPPRRRAAREQLDLAGLRLGSLPATG